MLPYLEWGIHWRVISGRPEHLQIHAASLMRDGKGVVLAGASGFGKSTLAAGLLSRGWDYLSDELGLIDPQTLWVHGFPKALRIKRGAFKLIEDLNLPLWRRRSRGRPARGGSAGCRRIALDCRRHRSIMPCGAGIA